jgi:zona occludens toxin
MSVLLYTGLMGSGKSYSAIENVILDCIKQGRPIVTNMVLRKGVIYEEFPDAQIITIPDEIDYDKRNDYFKLSLFPSGAVFVIDEAGELFPSGEKQNNVPQETKQFFTKHRHSVGFDGKSSEIILMTQNAAQLASWVRELVDSQYHHTKLDKHGMSKMFRVDLYDGAHTGNSIPDKYKTKSLTGTYKEDVFRYYKSHTKNESSFESGLEEKVDNRSNFLGVYRNAILAAIAFPFLCWLAYIKLTDIFGTPDQSQTIEVKQGDTPIEVKEQKSKTPEQRLSEMIAHEIPSYRLDPLAQLPESKKYKLVGRISTPRGLLIMIRGEDTTINLKASQQCSYRRITGEWWCVLGGELIASHTGPQFSDEGVREDSGFDLFDSD